MKLHLTGCCEQHQCFVCECCRFYYLFVHRLTCLFGVSLCWHIICFSWRIASCFVLFFEILLHLHSIKQNGCVSVRLCARCSVPLFVSSTFVYACMCVAYDINCVCRFLLKFFFLRKKLAFVVQNIPREEKKCAKEIENEILSTRAAVVDVYVQTGHIISMTKRIKQ